MSNEASSKSGFDLDTFVLPEPAFGPSGKEMPREPLVDPDRIIRLIFRKLKQDDAFLTFTRQIGEVNKILQLKYASASDIAQVILNDVPLTSKLLKLVNSSFYRHFSPEGISTITEAMIIVGTDQIKFLAASLKLIEMMQNIGESNLLKEKILKGVQRGIIAGEVARAGGFVRSEKLQISSILFDFGEYLVTAFAPDVCRKVQYYGEQRGIDVETAARTVMGISYKELGLVVAGKWHLPKTVTRAMTPITDYNIEKDVLEPEESLRFLCAFADDLCGVRLDGDAAEAEKALRKIKARYGSLFTIPEKTLAEIIRSSAEKIAEHAGILKISPEHEEAAVSCIKDRVLIDSGIEAIRKRLVSEFTVQEIFESALNILSEGFRFRNINFCIRDPRNETMNPRYVIGPDKGRFLSGFKFKILKTNDLFNQSLHGESIVLVDRIKESAYQGQIPLWYREGGFSQAFALVPMGLEGRIVSLLYLDWDPDGVRICRETRDCLDTFRELVTDALKRRR